MASVNRFKPNILQDKMVNRPHVVASTAPAPITIGSFCRAAFRGGKASVRQWYSYRWARRQNASIAYSEHKRSKIETRALSLVQG